jgi:hypothetical protein
VISIVIMFPYFDPDSYSLNEALDRLEGGETSFYIFLVLVF